MDVKVEELVGLRLKTGGHGEIERSGGAGQGSPPVSGSGAAAASCTSAEPWHVTSPTASTASAIVLPTRNAFISSMYRRAWVPFNT